MFIKDIIREWLGINDLIHIEKATRQYIRIEIKQLEDSIKVNNTAIGRLIAKLDPSYGKSEISDSRKAASDHIADEVIARLHAEELARKPYNV